MGRWVGGWVDRWIKEKEAVRMHCCKLWGGLVGGKEGELFFPLVGLGGWMGGWVGGLTYT